MFVRSLLLSLFTSTHKHTKTHTHIRTHTHAHIYTIQTHTHTHHHTEKGPTRCRKYSKTFLRRYRDVIVQECCFPSSPRPLSVWLGTHVLWDFDAPPPTLLERNTQWCGVVWRVDLLVFVIVGEVPRTPLKWVKDLSGSDTSSLGERGWSKVVLRSTLRSNGDRPMSDWVGSRSSGLEVSVV